MIEFVPSWYTDTKSWDSLTHHWHQIQQNKADDALSQLKIFCQAGEDAGVTNLAYMPGMRRHLLSEGISKARMWSVFDEMQGIFLTEIANVNFRDLSWPEGMEWVFSPFLMWGYLEEELNVRLEFSPDGELTETDLFQNGDLALRYDWDDRGFVSRVTRYSKERAEYRDYLNPEGVIQFREQLPDGRVLIAPGATRHFRHASYPSLRELIAEVLNQRLSEFEKDDILIVSSDQRHNEWFLHKNRKTKVLLSVQEIKPENASPKMLDDLLIADRICCDSQWSANRLLAHFPELSEKVLVEPPIDARMEIGSSSEQKEEYLFYPVDNLSDEILSRSLKLLEQTLEQNENAVLVLATSSSQYAEKEAIQRLRERVERLSSIRVPADDIDLGENGRFTENEEPGEEPRTMLVSYADTAELEKLLKETRIILEMEAEPSERLQIMGIGMGIPQILAKPSRYVDHLQDGYVLTSLDELPAAICYYLQDLNRWNEAMLNCMQKVEYYSGEHIVRRLKQFAEGRGNDQ